MTIVTLLVILVGMSLGLYLVLWRIEKNTDGRLHLIEAANLVLQTNLDAALVTIAELRNQIQAHRL